MSAALTDNEVLPEGVMIEEVRQVQETAPTCKEIGDEPIVSSASCSPKTDPVFLDPDYNPVLYPEDSDTLAGNGTLPLPRLPAHELAIARQFSYQPLQDSRFPRAPWYASVRFGVRRGLSGGGDAGAGWGQRSLGRHWLLLVGCAVFLLVVLAVGIPFVWIYTNKQKNYQGATSIFNETTTHNSVSDDVS